VVFLSYAILTDPNMSLLAPEQAFLAAVTGLVGECPETFTREWFENLGRKAATERLSPDDAVGRALIRDYCRGVLANWEELQKKIGVYAGPFRLSKFRSGQEVFVPEGAMVWYRGEPISVRRGGPVRIHMAAPGFAYHDKCFVFKNPSITWAGSGGYWKELELGVGPLPEAFE
jgi:hypothetical protein